MKKRILVGFIFGFFMFGLLFSGAYAQQKGMRRYSIATGGTQGTFYFVGAGVSKIIHQYLPEIEIVVE